MIYLFDLEYVETRYTAQWKTELPQQIADTTGSDVTIIEGPADIAGEPTPGAFLDFAGTNIYKSAQVAHMSMFFREGKVKDGDHFVFADAWHPGILQLKYMLELLQIKGTIHALWHAGSYDPYDFLGRLIGDAPWVRHTERALFHSIDKNYFASKFHIELFVNTFGEEVAIQDKIVRTGWPMEYLTPVLQADTVGTEKQNLILFPHRNAPEKQLNIFEDLKKELPEYNFMNCQEHKLTKKDYHKLLGEAKMVFSANLQETLGISCYEILRTGGVPFVPNRLSYTEMYEDIFLYPSEWTETWKSYQEHKEEIKERIVYFMDNFNSNEIQGAINVNKDMLEEQYFSATNLYKELI